MQPYLEHANTLVADVDATTRFLLTALPGWRVRGGGTMDWFGTPARWQHVGDDGSYVALMQPGGGSALDWRDLQRGVKHLGFVVPDFDAVVARLVAAGWPVDHAGPEHPHRRNAYFVGPDGLVFEFVAYRSAVAAERNHYPA